MGIPSKPPLSIVALIITFRPSIAIIKRKGDNRSPCLTPLNIENSSVGLPLTSTVALADSRHPFIHRLHFHPKFICSIIESRYSQFTESNALLKSSLNNNIFQTLLFTHEHNSLTIKGPSNMLLPSTNDDYVSSIQLLIHFFTRIVITFVTILYRAAIRLIGL